MARRNREDVINKNVTLVHQESIPIEDFYELERLKIGEVAIINNKAFKRIAVDVSLESEE